MPSGYSTWSCMALCAWLVKRLTDRLFADRTKSQLAAALFVLSIAATAHVGDLSPHLLAIAFSYLWTLLLLRIEVRSAAIDGTNACWGSPHCWAPGRSSRRLLSFGLATLAIFLFKRRNFAGRRASRARLVRASPTAACGFHAFRFRAAGRGRREPGVAGTSKAPAQPGGRSVRLRLLFGGRAGEPPFKRQPARRADRRAGTHRAASPGEMASVGLFSGSHRP